MKILLDQEREIEITGYSIMKFEKETGKSIFKIGDEPKMTDIIYLVWAFLKEDMKLDDVARLINLKNMRNITQTLTELMNESNLGNE
jgi:hypothetical protein